MLPFLFALSGVEVPLPLTLSLASSGRLTEWASWVSQATLWILSLSGVYRVEWPTHWVRSSQSGDSVNPITEWCVPSWVTNSLSEEQSVRRLCESYHWAVKRQNTRSGVSTDTQLLVFCLFYLSNFGNGVSQWIISLSSQKAKHWEWCVNRYTTLGVLPFLFAKFFSGNLSTVSKGNSSNTLMTKHQHLFISQWKSLKYKDHA